MKPLPTTTASRVLAAASLIAVESARARSVKTPSSSQPSTSSLRGAAPVASSSFP
jgi:hypothetical protein